VLAAACAAIVVVLGGYRLQQQYLSVPGNEMELSADLMLPEDLEIINNYDLLKDMDTIEKLIHVVDIPGNGHGSEEETPEETQGMRRDENGKNYA